MKLTTTAAALALAAVGLLSACSSDGKSATTTPSASDSSSASPTVPTDATIPALTLPPGLSIPEGGTIPSDITIPQALIDQLVATLTAEGLKVDAECFTNLLKDEEMRKIIVSATTPTADVMQKLAACIKS